MQNQEAATHEAYDRQHQAVHQLMDHIDETVPSITLSSTSKNTFLGAAALFRCNRLLRSVDSAADNGLGDTVSGNVRALYETWVLGHLILLGGDEQVQQAWATARGHSDRLMRSLQDSDVLDGPDVEPLDYPALMPEPSHDTNTRSRAEALGKRLNEDDPDFADLPELWYTTLYRITSHTGSHASANTLAPSIIPLGNGDATIGLNSQNQDGGRDVLMAAYITGYFASRVFTAARLDLTSLDDIRHELMSGSPVNRHEKDPGPEAWGSFIG